LETEKRVSTLETALQMGVLLNTRTLVAVLVLFLWRDGRSRLVALADNGRLLAPRCLVGRRLWFGPCPVRGWQCDVPRSLSVFIRM
jgi:hypothetical protein